MKKENFSVDDYYVNVKRKVFTLATIGEPLRDSEFIAYLLVG